MTLMYEYVSVINEVIPGEELDIDLNVFDQFGNEIFAVVTSEVNDLNGASVLGESGFWFTGENNATVRIFGLQNQTLNTSYFTFNNAAITTSVEMSLLSCPAGFKYDVDTGTCVCDDDVFVPPRSDFIKCDPLSIAITTNSSVWVELHKQHRHHDTILSF